jgi:hypothetical protein
LALARRPKASRVLSTRLRTLRSQVRTSPWRAKLARAGATGCKSCYEQRLEFRAALQELRKLPLETQQVVLIRSQVWKQGDVADVMGISRQRVATLSVDAALKVAELNEERHEKERLVALPRAARLRELEDAPPEWLRSAIGTRPGRAKSSGGSCSRGGFGDRRLPARLLPSLGDGRDRSDADRAAARRCYQRAERAIAEVAVERECRSGISRGR